MSRREHRFPMMLNQDEVNALDDWRFANRIPTRSRAARTLIERGLVADELLAALKGLLADIEDYQRINNLGGEDNHWQVIARAAIAKAEQRSGTEGEGSTHAPAGSASDEIPSASHSPSPKPSRREVA